MWVFWHGCNCADTCVTMWTKSMYSVVIDLNSLEFLHHQWQKVSKVEHCRDFRYFFRALMKWHTKKVSKKAWWLAWFNNARKIKNFYTSISEPGTRSNYPVPVPRFPRSQEPGTRFQVGSLEWYMWGVSLPIILQPPWWGGVRGGNVCNTQGGTNWGGGRRTLPNACPWVWFGHPFAKSKSLALQLGCKKKTKKLADFGGQLLPCMAKVPLFYCFQWKFDVKSSI